MPLDAERGSSWPARIANCNRELTFPENLKIAGDGRVIGIWIMGNDYRVRSN